MINIIQIPIIDEGAEEVLISNITINKGDIIKKGQVIAEAETYKTVFQIESQYSGIIKEIFVKENTMYKLPLKICSVEDTSSATPLKQIQISPRARRLLINHNINMEDFAGNINKKLIKEKDVLEFIQKNKKIAESQKPDIKLPDFANGNIKESFYEYLIKDYNNNRDFFKLSCDEKISKLRSAGAYIGKNVIFGAGAVVIGKKIIIEDNVKIGRETIIECDEIRILKDVVFENNCIWSCRKIKIGKFTYISAESRVGWGGEKNKTAELEIGEFSHLGEQVMINPSQKVFIDRDVSIGAGSKLYTHQFWQSVLEGYTALHKPITILENVQVGANVVILPGTVIDKGITVAANSLVSGEYIGPGLLMGNPAKFYQKLNYPRKLNQQEKNKIVIDILKKFSQDNKGKVKEETDNNLIIETLKLEIYFNCFKKSDSMKQKIFIGFDDKQNRHINTVFNLKKLEIKGKTNEYTDIIREFFRKYGIKFKSDWRYTFRNIKNI